MIIIIFSFVFKSKKSFRSRSELKELSFTIRLIQINDIHNIPFERREKAILFHFSVL